MIVGLSVAGVGLALVLVGLCVMWAGDREMRGYKEQYGGDPVIGCIGVVAGRLAAWLGVLIILCGGAIMLLAPWHS
jgi:uncharacterized membrane protein